MTKREGAVLSAYTGILLTNFEDFHKYAEEILKRPVHTFELTQKEVWNELKEKATEDFNFVCTNQN